MQSQKDKLIQVHRSSSTETWISTRCHFPTPLLIRFFLSFRLWETSQTSEEPIIYCVEFETRKDKNVKLNPQS